MLFYIRHQDKEYRVRVESREGTYYVTYGEEQEQPIDIFFYGNDCTLVHETGVFSANVVGTKTDYTVWRPQGNLAFTVESEYRRIVGLLRGQNLEEGGNVYAKMPGKITKVFVKNGQEVEKNAAVMVMEAMKMENEIRTSVAGKVKMVSVKEGQAVETGALLLELEPEESNG